MGIFRQQHDAEGVPIQPGHGVKGAALPGFLVISGDIICQRPRIFRPGGVNQHPGRLLHRQNSVILIENRQFPVLRRVFRGFLCQSDSNYIPGLHRVIRPLRNSIYPNGIPPFQLVHEACGHFQFSQQEGRKPPCPHSLMRQFHVLPPIYIEMQNVKLEFGGESPLTMRYELGLSHYILWAPRP